MSWSLRSTHTHTQMLSVLQCFFITNQPQEIINEGLGGYTAAKPRRMSVRRENYLFKGGDVLGRTGSLKKNSFLAKKFFILRNAKIKWVRILHISQLRILEWHLIFYWNQEWHIRGVQLFPLPLPMTMFEEIHEIV